MNTRSMNPAAGYAERSIAAWLFGCCALVFAMVILGGVTRLTGSGLSMVNWHPVYGILPPLSQTEWQDLFNQYRQFPEYRLVNYGMDLEGFQSIFWLEYLHRILGRLIGVAFFLPLVYFWWRQKLPSRLAPKLLVLFVLGGLQGLLGWYMVKSGLVDNPHVSQYRLTAHLLLAVLIYGYMLWLALNLWSPRAAHSHSPRLYRSAGLLIGLIILTLASGGLVAGLKAGMIYNTFPMMGDHWLPPELLGMQPWYLNLLENPTTLQFDHRVLASLTFLSVLGIWWSARRSQSYAAHLLLGCVLLQLSLGVSTLLLQVPIVLASLHQTGALLLLTAAIYLLHRLRASEQPATILRKAYAVDRESESVVPHARYN